MIIIAGSSCHKLANSIAKILSVPCSHASVKKFHDQELRVQIEAALHQEDVVIVQSTSKPSNDNLMELLLLIDTARRASTRSISAVVPYFGYSRQDRSSYKYGPVSASLVASLLEAAGLDRIVTIDLHSKQIEGFFKIGIQNFDQFELYKPLFANISNSVIVSPDIGGVARAQKFCTELGLPLAVINKTRASNGNCRMNCIIGDVSGKKCILIDDIIDSGETICKASALLMTNGAASVTAYITHAVLSKGAENLLERSAIDKLYVTNSIAHETLLNKINVIAVDQLLARALRK